MACLSTSKKQMLPKKWDIFEIQKYKINDIKYKKYKRILNISPYPILSAISSVHCVEPSSSYIKLVGRGPGDQGSIPGWVIPKT